MCDYAYEKSAQEMAKVFRPTKISSTKSQFNVIGKTTEHYSRLTV